MIAQEGSPALLGAWIRPGLRQVAGDGGETHSEPELRQFPLDPASAPAVLRRHPDDQVLRLSRDRRTPGSARGDRSPMVAKAAVMPAEDGLGLDHDQDGPPARPPSGEGDPESSVEGRNRWPRVLLVVNRELLAQGELDDRLVLPAPEQGRDAAERSDEKSGQGAHRAWIVTGPTAEGKSASFELVGLLSADELQCRARGAGETPWDGRWEHRRDPRAGSR
jgi:hypothetical protein